MSGLIISVSGLRGVIGPSLTPEVAMRYVAALAAELPDGPLVLSGDGRTTGAMLADVVRGALVAAGRDVIDAGIAATPTVGALVRQRQAAGGVQISASHNPPAYNGIKLFDARGRVLPADAGRRVAERYHGEPPEWVAHERIGSVRPCDDPHAGHEQLVLATVDAPRIRERRFRVLLDSNHGAGSLLGQRLLERLGCDLVLVGGTADGRFEHPPEPLAENLVEVARATRESGADVGFCQDPDADRLAVIDHAGRYLGEEYTLALCLDHVLPAQSGPVVANCATSRMAQDLAERYGVPFYRSAVGEANVVDLMLRHRAVFGGEGNGGPIDPRVGYIRDSFVGMALILDALAARGQPVADLADALPRYAIEKTKLTLDPTRVASAFDALERHFADAASSRLDGLRLDWPRAWLLVRASNTEPIVRIIAEAPSSDDARRLTAEAQQVVAGSCGAPS